MLTSTQIKSVKKAASIIFLLPMLWLFYTFYSSYVTNYNDPYALRHAVTTTFFVHWGLPVLMLPAAVFMWFGNRQADQAVAIISVLLTINLLVVAYAAESNNEPVTLGYFLRLGGCIAAYVFALWSSRLQTPLVNRS